MTEKTLQEKFDSLSCEQYVQLLNQYEWNIRLNRVWENLYIDWNPIGWVFFIVNVKDKKKTINIWMSKDANEAIKKWAYKLAWSGWFTEEQILGIYSNN